MLCCANRRFYTDKMKDFTSAQNSQLIFLHLNGTCFEQPVTFTAKKVVLKVLNVFVWYLFIHTSFTKETRVLKIIRKPATNAYPDNSVCNGYIPTLS